jgi:phosphoglycerate dehydrogenase-like enzyme
MADAVAEFALLMALTLLRRLHTFDRAMFISADWQAAERAGLGQELSAQRVGVIGASRVGRSFIRMVKALGADVTVSDPFMERDDAYKLKVSTAELDELLTQSSIVSVHAPSTPETRKMIGRAELGRMPDGAILINTARSALIDEGALVDELVSGRLQAGLDVFDSEPLPVDHPFLRLPNVLVTPHQAGATEQARRLQGRITVDEVERFLKGETLQHEVTAENYDRLA